MLMLLPKLKGPYFEFLLFPAGQCWDRRGDLKKECFHHPEALRIQHTIISVFTKAFEQSSQRYYYYRPTEYTDAELRHLGQLLTQAINDIRSCRTPKQFQAKLPALFRGDCEDELGNWLPKWRRVRNELEIYGRQILRRVEQADREQKALLVLGV